MALYFVNARSLRRELADETLTQRDYFWYLVLTGIGVPLWIPEVAPPQDRLLPELVFTFLFLAVAIGGTYHCYLRNGGPSGRRFVERFIPLGWVIGLRLFVPLALALLVAAVPLAWLAAWLDLAPVIYMYTAYGIMIALQVLFFWRVGVHIRSVAIVSTARTLPG